MASSCTKAFSRDVAIEYSVLSKNMYSHDRILTNEELRWNAPHVDKIKITNWWGNELIVRMWIVDNKLKLSYNCYTGTITVMALHSVDNYILSLH